MIDGSDDVDDSRRAEDEKATAYCHGDGSKVQPAKCASARMCKFSQHSSCARSAALAETRSAAAGVARHQDKYIPGSDILQLAPASDRFIDDLTGLPLPPELCRAARQKEISYFRAKGVWELRPINEARTRMGRRPISVRWVETNKGDDDHPNIRSRLVAREIRMAGEEAIFAPTPPLESLRMILSMASTAMSGNKWQPNWSPDSEDHTQIMLVDISRE